MKKINFNIQNGQLLSILKGDATRFIEYSPNGSHCYNIGESLQIDPTQVNRLIRNKSIRYSIPFRSCFLNNYNDIFSLEPDTLFMIQINNIRRLRATDFSLTDTLRLGVKSCNLSGCQGYMIPNFESYTCEVFSSSICALQAYIKQICSLKDEIITSNPTYNIYEFTTIINPDLDDETEIDLLT